MNQIKFRTIEEASSLPFVPTTREHLEQVRKDIAFVKYGNASRLAKVRRIYQAADLLTSEISPMAVCSQGCGSCCHIDVDVTEIEALYIEKNSGHKVRPGRSRTNGHGDRKTPCCFLSSTQICTIYECRPFACRTHFAFDDPKFCSEIDVDHVTYDARGNPYLTELAAILFELNGSAPPRDIRDFFEP